MARKYFIDIEKISAINWARLAAYIDGEGSIYVSGRKTTQLIVEICCTDPRLALWCADTFGGCINRKGHMARGQRNRAYKWRVSSSTAESILLGCLPFFVIKREQAEVGIAYRETYRHKGGHDRVTPVQLAERQKVREELSRLKRELPNQPELIQ